MTAPALREDVQRVSGALVRAWLGVMSTGQPVNPDDLAPLREGARRRATQGIDLQSMLRAYRLGIRVMWTELVNSPEWQNGPLAGAGGHITRKALDFPRPRQPDGPTAPFRRHRHGLRAPRPSPT